jgi:hypothetical protein
VSIVSGKLCDRVCTCSIMPPRCASVCRLLCDTLGGEDCGTCEAIALQSYRPHNLVPHHTNMQQGILKLSLTYRQTVSRQASQTPPHS